MRANGFLASSTYPSMLRMNRHSLLLLFPSTLVLELISWVLRMLARVATPRIHQLLFLHLANTSVLVELKEQQGRRPAGEYGEAVDTHINGELYGLVRLRGDHFILD
jgi:hypothetical protein